MAGNPRNLAGTLHAAGFIFFGLGDRERADSLWREVANLAERTRDPAVTVYRLLDEVLVSYIDGDLERAAERRDDLVARAEELGGRFLAVNNSFDCAFRALLELGRPEGAAAVIETLEAVLPLNRGARIHIHALLGRVAEAAALLSVEGRDPAATPSQGLMWDFESAIAVRNTDRAATIAPFLVPSRGLALLYYTVQVSPGRLLGDAAVLLGQYDEARDYYEEALEICHKVRFRPEIALIRLHLAALLLDHFPDQRADAQEQLDLAIGEFRRWSAR